VVPCCCCCCCSLSSFSSSSASWPLSFRIEIYVGSDRSKWANYSYEFSFLPSIVLSWDFVDCSGSGVEVVVVVCDIWSVFVFDIFSAPVWSVLLWEGVEGTKQIIVSIEVNWNIQKTFFTSMSHTLCCLRLFIGWNRESARTTEEKQTKRYIIIK
jgi:hypothetical protein